VKTLTLGGGCFWCIEAVYDGVMGVVKAESGYMGGDPEQANYKDVCSGTTGHAEVVQITYDEDQVDLEELLDIFWVVHDPTTLNQQGADRGTQYRSVIYYANDEEQKIVEESVLKAQKLYDDPIVTELSPIEDFFVAEGYHQSYFKNNPDQGYCRAVVAPKVQKFKMTFRDLLK
jgi:methionine-S-sulfoxide reductase